MNQSSDRAVVIAIDGPAGAGKSTIAMGVARALGFQLIDTGAIYRTVAYTALDRGVDLSDGEALANIARELDFHFELAADGKKNLIFCNGEQLGDEIRSPAVSQSASKVSSRPEVRAALLELQRSLGRARSSVLEGRDIGTVVFPDADLKIFLTATAEERARRRTMQMKERGEQADYAEILAEIQERDARDIQREHAPLKQADDAVAIDSTSLGIGGIVDKIVALVAD